MGMTTTPGVDRPFREASKWWIKRKIRKHRRIYVSDTGNGYVGLAAQHLQTVRVLQAELDARTPSAIVSRAIEKARSDMPTIPPKGGSGASDAHARSLAYYFGNEAK